MLLDNIYPFVLFFKTNDISLNLFDFSSNKAGSPNQILIFFLFNVNVEIIANTFSNNDIKSKINELFY